MEIVKMKKVTLVRGKWGDKDSKKGKKVQRKHILVCAILEDKGGNEFSWCPSYEDLKELYLHLIALHGEIEVFSCILGDGDTEAFKKYLEEEG